jgi:hypothetical protein
MLPKYACLLHVSALVKRHHQVFKMHEEGQLNTAHYNDTFFYLLGKNYNTCFTKRYITGYLQYLYSLE